MHHRGSYVTRRTFYYAGLYYDVMIKTERFMEC